MALKTFSFAVLQAVQQEMQRDSNLTLLYEYQRPTGISPMGTVIDLYREFGPVRVPDWGPIDEEWFVGACAGMAMTGVPAIARCPSMTKVRAFDAFFLTGAFGIRVSPGYAHIGPRFFPFLVSGGLAACGVALLLQALRKEPAAAGAGEGLGGGTGVNWRPILGISVALALQVFLMERAGFVLASTLLFWGVAFGFGSRQYVRDGLIGFHLALFVYLAFTRLLDLNLPGGLLTTILQRITGGS